MDDYVNVPKLFTLVSSSISYDRSCNTNIVHIMYLPSMDTCMYLPPPRLLRIDVHDHSWWW